MIISSTKPTSWKDLQNKVGELLFECGFQVEVEKVIKTVRSDIEIDVYAEENIDGRVYSILCECKYWGSAIPQTIVHAFRTVISDIGTNVGYIITTSEFQSGSVRTSENTNIELLTWEKFQNLFFMSWYSKYFFKKLNSALSMTDDYQIVDWYDDLTPEDKRKYHEIRNNLGDIYEVVSLFPFRLEGISNPTPIPQLPLSATEIDLDEYYGCVPKDILHIPTFREFLSEFINFAKPTLNEFRELSNKYSTN